VCGRPGTEATLTAYKIARARAAAAAEVETELLHALVYDAQEAGRSVRETSAMLQVAKSTVARHRLNRGTGMFAAGSTWLTPEAYVEAYNAAYADAPEQHIEAAPFVMEELPDGSRRVVAVPMDRRAVTQFRSARPPTGNGRS